MTQPAGPVERFDTIVIGAGQAGPGLAAGLAQRGERVALIEQDRFGGTCLNSGCRPTKAIRASAHAAHVARSSVPLGVHVGDVRVDLAAVMDRKDAMIDAWRSGSANWFEHHDRIAWMHARGRFVSSDGAGFHQVRAGDQMLLAPRVILNPGARTSVPQIPGLDTVPWIDHHGALSLREVPDHLIVIGGSYIGLEFAQIYRRFGADVTLIEGGPRIIAREDNDVSDAVAAFLTAEGVDIRCGHGVARVAGVANDANGQVVVSLDDGAEIAGSHLLLAVGRRPNSDDLGLEHVGVVTDARGYITTDGQFRTNVEGIFAVGDVNGRGAFTHTSYQDYEILADVLAGGSRTVDHRTTTYALFTDPPLGRIGMSEREARAADLDVRVATVPMSKVTKAALDGVTDGLIRLVIDTRTDRFVGAACLGLFGDEVVQLISMMMHLDAPASALSTWLPVHPTVTEFLPTIAAGAS
jgi:pyruvate/2-oxoglutarate dehydrogenase complex dihydrolipoamide dehydrogenase (E3) component